MFRRAISAVAASAVVLGGLTFTATPASAGTAPTAATYGATAAVDVLRSPGYPACSGSTYNQWSVTSTGNPISQTAYNDTGSTADARVDLSAVTYNNGSSLVTAAMVLKVVRLPAATPQGFALKMFLASDGTTEIFWNSTRDEWSTTGVTLTNSFSNGGYAYAVYSGGFLHEGAPTTGRFGIGTFMMIDDTLPTGTQLVYTPSPGSDNTCIGSRTYATAAGMDSTSLGGSGTKITPSSSSETPPTIRLEINGNGGVCTPSFVEGEQGTWGTAPTADKCTNGSRQLAFFSTSPTAEIGATNVRPGGPVFFLTANLLYAIWAPDKPSPVTDVVATPGLNSVKVTWKAPVSDGGAPINSYCIALRTEQNPNPFPRCLNAAQSLELTFSLPATNTKYTPTVFARNSAGSSEPVAGAPASPYDIKGVTASRKDLLLGLGGTQVEARGDAPGLAGQSLNVEYKVGAGQWTTQANAVSVDAKSNFRWSKKFPRSSNKNAVTVRFSYGTDAVVGPFVLTRGGEAGDLSAPRNIKVDNRPNKIKVTWDRPKFDGGATITGYTLCATPGAGIGGRICRSETGTEGIFWNLNTRQTYTFTVSAKTSTREGPRGKYSKPVDPTDASIRSAARSFDELTADVRGAGFKKNSRFRVEVASPVPGVNPDKWDWDQVTSFREDQESFTKSLRIPLDAGLRGERLMLRLITPEGTVYSRPSRP